MSTEFSQQIFTDIEPSNWWSGNHIFKLDIAENELNYLIYKTQTSSIPNVVKDSKIKAAYQYIPDVALALLKWMNDNAPFKEDILLQEKTKILIKSFLESLDVLSSGRKISKENLIKAAKEYEQYFVEKRYNLTVGYTLVNQLLVTAIISKTQHFHQCENNVSYLNASMIEALYHADQELPHKVLSKEQTIFVQTLTAGIYKYHEGMNQILSVKPVADKVQDAKVLVMELESMKSQISLLNISEKCKINFAKCMGFLEKATLGAIIGGVVGCIIGLAVSAGLAAGTHGIGILGAPKIIYACTIGGGSDRYFNRHRSWCLQSRC